MKRRRKTNDESVAVGNHATREAELSASRRHFTKTLAAAFVAAPALAAQTPTPAPAPLALTYFEVARQRFGASLTPEQLEAVKRDLEGNVRAAERLRAFKLKNSDEPDFVFEA